MDPSAVSTSLAKSSELLSHFGRLFPEEREVLLLVAVERMGYEEIAELLQVPVSTVMVRLKRARAFLRPADDSYPQGSQALDQPLER